MIQGAPYRMEVDIWSMGCFMHELATGKTPFESKDARKHIFEAIVEDAVQEVPNQSLAFNELMRKCLEKDPADRPTMAEFLDHEFFNGAEECRTGWVQVYKEYLR